MSATRESSVSTGYENSGTTSDGSTEDVVYTDTITVVSGSTEGTGDGSSITFTGDATAVGTDTYTEMDVDALVADNGASTTVSLSADVVAAAATADFDPFATTTLLYEVSGPIDSFIQIEETERFTATGPDGSVTVQSSSADFDGVVLEDPLTSDPVEAPLEVPADQSLEPTAPSDPSCGCVDDGTTEFDPTMPLDGNTAVFDFEANAIGEDSVASVTFDAFAVEESISTITAVVEVAIA